ncbi:type II toxin-antitoxin system Phd/YefM family antitoxin [Pengzhenrongella frigida]|uniref:Antitoxin n=1 Tax=Pengzhenrongella frigida TaxID=1259133 RepID=A0A4Q5MY47_9MICO|nr:type II toxin-antitoxin system prevent-host-death family antitoxin [Cellulomonas sp. HLT2-17]RYV50585.1 type II toxin-antitoxin system prevent-host-death family antitoxin [Cellulomonas sp. HLT2-17]
MEVSVSALRAELKQWIDAARSGQDVVITDRGVPVARLSPIASTDLLTRLQREGVIGPPAAVRPAAEAHDRNRPAQALSGLARRLRR